MNRLTITSSHSVRWAAEVAKWRQCLVTGTHPTTGKAHDRAEAMHGARTCAAFALLARTAHLAKADRPMAAQGLRSYRARGRFGVIMIGARDDAEAMREALRSTDKPEGLERWTGVAFAPVTIAEV
jgi:hypothetical protein